MSSNMRGMASYKSDGTAYVYVLGDEGRLELVRFREGDGRGGRERRFEPSTYLGALAYNDPPAHRVSNRRCEGSCCTIQ